MDFRYYSKCLGIVQCSDEQEKKIEKMKFQSNLRFFFSLIEEKSFGLVRFVDALTLPKRKRTYLHNNQLFANNDLHE